VQFFRIVRELCSVETEPRGLRFDPDTVTADCIAEDADYEGVRVSFTADLAGAKIRIQIDIGFGDAVTLPPVENNYPTLLGSPAPRLLTYPRETVVAEKLEAMVKLGIANSRMKDFYDMDVLSRTFSFGGKSLREAIHNTFERRGTELLFAWATIRPGREAIVYALRLPRAKRMPSNFCVGSLSNHRDQLSQVTRGESYALQPGSMSQ
jgi:hypothetical protein